MKINPKEVRIGNLVEYDGRTFEIDSIAEEFPTLNTTEFGIGVVDWNNIKPVELTEEWLLKFGFTTDYYGGQGNAGTTAIKETGLNLPHKNPFELYQHSGSSEWRFEKFMNYNTKIQFVHQLQNLYFALTGKELKIK